MKRLLLALSLCMFPISAQAANTVYTGSLVVPSAGSITLTGANQNNCLIIGAAGVVTSAACPQGTAAFSGSAPITITGAGPYTIGCATCVTNVTASGNLSSSGGTTPAITLSASPTFTGVTSGTLTLSGALSGTSATYTGTVTATQYNISSKGSYKQDIQPLSVDALEVLHNICWSSYRYRPGHGDPAQTHIGFIADCAPSIVSGSKHDHYDIEAVSTVDALAILQLQNQMRMLYLSVILLVFICLTLAVIALAKKG